MSPHMSLAIHPGALQSPRLCSVFQAINLDPIRTRLLRWLEMTITFLLYRCWKSGCWFGWVLSATAFTQVISLFFLLIILILLEKQDYYHRFILPSVLNGTLMGCAYWQGIIKIYWKQLFHWYFWDSETLSVPSKMWLASPHQKMMGKKQRRRIWRKILKHNYLYFP